MSLTQPERRALPRGGGAGWRAMRRCRTTCTRTAAWPAVQSKYLLRAPRASGATSTITRQASPSVSAMSIAAPSPCSPGVRRALFRGNETPGLFFGECWRRGRDSNPRYVLPYARFPSVCLKPLGHPSVERKLAAGQSPGGPETIPATPILQLSGGARPPKTTSMGRPAWSYSAAEGIGRSSRCRSGSVRGEACGSAAARRAAASSASRQRRASSDRLSRTSRSSWPRGVRP